jgi:hypothetical protein
MEKTNRNISGITAPRNKFPALPGNNCEYVGMSGCAMIDVRPSRLSPEEITRARSRFDIIAADVPLKRKGRELAGLCPFHAERTPSFYVVPDKGWFHCFSGDTVIPTPDGWHRIGDMAGQLAYVQSPEAGWVPAFIDSFGRQRLWEITLHRDGIERRVLATAGHRWFARGRISPVMTRDLVPGMQLTASKMRNREHWYLDEWAVVHGIVFGDGTMKDGCYGVVDLHDEKTELFEHFRNLRFDALRHERDDDHCCLRVYGGRRFEGFKNLPDIRAEDRYLLGFLAGWVATDGCVDDRDGSVTLAASVRANLEWARVAALKIGLETSAVRVYSRTGYCDHPTALYSIQFRRGTLDPKFLLRSKHRRRFSETSIEFERKRWVVSEVHPTVRTDEVFCAKVPDSHAFALTDDLVTGNCFGCGAHGSVIDYVMRIRGLSFPEAVHEINGTTPRKPREASLPDAGRAPPAATEDDQAAVDRILRDCRPVEPGTAAYLYLHLRGLISPRHRAPTEAALNALRAHPGLDCAETGQRLPALIAPITSTRGVTAVQRIWCLPRVEYINGVGPKDSRAPLDTRKKTRGAMLDGAVRMGTPRRSLGLAEGVETAIAAAILNRGMPVWATCGASRLGSVAIPEGVELIRIYGDNGATGQELADCARARYERQGYAVEVRFPRPRFSDFNDELLGETP